jgi:8-oxo-dGTP diphosphatase
VTIRVLAAVVQRDDRYLVCRRPVHKRHGGLWEFPGGKLEPDESLSDAAHREMREELGVEVRDVGEPLLGVADAGSPFVIEFVPLSIVGEPRCIEHSAVAWLTIDALRKLELAPSDRTFVEFLVEQHVGGGYSCPAATARGGDR